MRFLGMAARYRIFKCLISWVFLVGAPGLEPGTHTAIPPVHIAHLGEGDLLRALGHRHSISEARLIAGLFGF
jgi:hypothetical protein